MIAMTAIRVIQPPPYLRYVTLSHLNVLSPTRTLGPAEGPESGPRSNRSCLVVAFTWTANARPVYLEKSVAGQAQKIRHAPRPRELTGDRLELPA